MRKGLITLLALILVLGSVGYTLAQQGPKNPCAGQQMMGQGQTGRQQMGPMGGQGMMGPGMGMMGGGMGMMGPMMGSPQMMGTMMSIRGEMMTLMGEMMQKYGGAMGQMTPEIRRQMQQQMMERMGEILTKHGKALKERAKASGK